jgi:predicted transposase YbfD/YdcC
MPCTVKKTLSAIIGSGNDYLVCLKQNQPKLYHAAEHLMAQQPMRDCYERREGRHGRRERRVVSVWDVAADDQSVRIDPAWGDLQCVIRVERWRQVKSPRQYPSSPESYQQSYYLTSRQRCSAYELYEMTRAHWQIENRLHWVKDVIQHEDGCGISGAQSAENLSALKSIALTLYRINGYSSLKHATICFANKIKELWDFMRT